ncbi:DUF4124 domain-containing protein [Ideonella sp. 4Y11]|uniref:DUF4124 domain-containing protein n=1 Tax=Ideonella aquatica TaxID=2824119 RepID=A0A940YIT7_9BURK|nr:DUF4124 domain-containing protein [Ideonella aquatica]MBQ0959477.1 DUF4124 domain-containing protein [Ideonella aquatica]
MRRSIALLAIACLALLPVVGSAQAIWKWKDANGTLQVSDTPPPTSVPDSAIISRPGGRVAEIVVGGSAEAPASTPSRSDSALEARKREQQAGQKAADAARAAATKERDQARREENCRQARQQQANLDSGMRMARLNDKGEREYLDDSARAAEAERVRQRIQQACN